ncbi:hypothetical protein A9W98_07650 [Mycobacterium gordonae]|jgi:hypothetical protein|uniref:DUF6671 domain-containing protein n=1 Tax=Mycobacterium gordonae TaxID=1778 RepID=A0A1A6BN50_MYCGO|nr:MULTISPECIES: DUF6671 family protein [Mycobacterium]MBI2702265.1 hypothetical protein [Mycobacterium sp.]OBS03768.1 hypothetical protein A9W98_07650 [Mycobacterium gordonae]PJE15401.1 MAG: hypothetical protein CK428_04680 [Mycobacterium sp.]
MNTRDDGYAGTVIAMGTMHGKERQVAPAFAAEFGAQVIVPSGIDTDRFGTFAGEVTRTLTPVAAATAKARLAMSAAKVPYGVASEASYDAWYGMLAVHQEILVFIDDTRGIQVLEGVNVPRAPGLPKLVESGHEAVDEARRFGFPEQGAVVKATIEGGIRVFGKGLTDAFALVEVVDAAVAAADDHRAWLEPDLRAHYNPSRREVLSALASRLAGRLATPCPGCLGPGYGRVAVREGLPCRACGSPTTLIAADVLGCPACEYRSETPRTGTAEPGYCPQCNP